VISDHCSYGHSIFLIHCIIINVHFSTLQWLLKAIQATFPHSTLIFFIPDNRRVPWKATEEDCLVWEVYLDHGKWYVIWTWNFITEHFTQHQQTPISPLTSADSKVKVLQFIHNRKTCIRVTASERYPWKQADLNKPAFQATFFSFRKAFSCLIEAFDPSDVIANG